MKKLLFFSLAVLMTVMASAKPVNPDRAVQVAKNFVAQYVKGAENFTATVVYTHPMPKSKQPAMYAVNVGNMFVIVSADDVAHPVLGYSLSRLWPTAIKGENASLPSQVSGYLDDLAAQIESAAGQQENPDRETVEEWHQLLSLNSNLLTTTNPPDSVGPLLTTTWDQDQYYNALCPEDANGPAGHVYTGCVATAMAQIINYWGYPIQGRGTHSYQSDYGTLTVNYDSANYDYANMPNVLTATSTPVQVNAVAKLMYDCGVAANMIYDGEGSGTSNIEARAALINHFRFSPNLSIAEKVYFSSNEWNTLLRENIAADCPIIYNGLSGNVGHSFVCDGYNSSDYFHFNFGWSGNGDGWYLTDAINPGNYYFNSFQSIIVSIVPDSTGNVILGQLEGTSVFVVDNPLMFYHLLGHNTYVGENNGIYCNSTTLFIPANENNQIVADILDFNGIQTSIIFFDGTSPYSLRILNGDNENNLSPVVSSQNAISLRYMGEVNYSGFRFCISQDGECRIISNVTYVVDTTSVHLSWSENGSSTQWEIEYGIKGFELGSGTIVTVNDTTADIVGLTKWETYDFYIRPVCSSIWHGPTSIRTDLSYWQDYVTAEPSGCTWNDEGYALVSTPEQLAWFLCDQRQSNILITADLDMSGHRWKPVKDYSGNFDGGNHFVSNLIIREENHLQTYAGFFENINNHNHIKNIIFVSPVISLNTNNENSGVLVGRVNGEGVLIENCGVIGGIINCSSRRAGGLIGDVWGTNVVRNCFTNTTLFNHLANHVTGGLFGYVWGHNNILNCYSASDIIFDYYYQNGQIIAYNDGGLIENCYGKASMLPLIDVNSASTGYIRDTSTFDSNGLLYNGIIFDDSMATTLIDVLNMKVQTQNDSSLRIWQADISNINNGFPMLGDPYIVTCPNVTNLRAENIIYNDQPTLFLEWDNSGNSTSFAVRCIKQNDTIPPVYFISDSNQILLNGLDLGEEYQINVHAICDNENLSGWGVGIYHIFDLPYWTEIVTEQPEGYQMDSNGNVTITSAEGFAWLSSCVNGLNQQNNNDFQGKTINLMADIDLGQYRWLPIGSWEHGFSGIFNGHGHSINNMRVSEKIDNVGLFGHLKEAKVCNLTILNGQVKGEMKVGGICGVYSTSWERMNEEYGNVIFESCHVIETNISGTYYVGGICGDMQPDVDNLMICNTSTSGNIYGVETIGGLMGGVRQDGVLLNNCFSIADIDINQNNRTGNVAVGYMGGLVGSTYNLVTTNCYYAGQIGRVNSIGFGPNFVGTLFGVMQNSITRYSYGLYDSILPPAIQAEGCIWEANNFAFTNSLGQCLFMDTVTIQNATYSTLLGALNAWVDAYDTAGIYRYWAADSANVNGGYPVFAAIPCITVTGSDTITVCDSYSWHGNIYTTSTDLIEILSTMMGCDSIVTHHLIVNHSNTNNETVTACEDYFFGGQWIYSSGQYTDTLTNAANCDSIVTLNLTINNPVHTAVTEVACDSYTWQGATLTTSGTYTYPHNDANGCTQVDTLHLTINHSNTGIETVTACDSYNWHGTAYTASNNTATFTETNANGCDSVVTLNLTVNYSNTGVETVTACDSYNWHGTAYAASTNTPTFTETNANGCDSIVTLNLTVNYSNTGIETVTACDSYTWHGANYTASTNTPIFTETNANGCDSVVTLNLTINYSNTNVETITACDSYTWHGTAYAASTNTPTFTETNANGCDSVVTLNLTVNYSNTGIETVTACDNYTWHGNNYTASNNTATFIETNAAGCDSVVTLQLTINQSTAGDTIAVACDAFAWYENFYTASGTHTRYTTNAAGCDSTVTLHLTINSAWCTVTTETACDSYFWYDSTYTTSGTYTYSFVDSNGCSGINTLHLAIVNAVNTAMTETACDTYTWNGTPYTASGNYTYSHLDANGCTQVDTLHLTINYSDAVNEIDTACEDYFFGGEWITVSGQYTDSLTNIAGCDSIVTLNLTVNNPVHEAVTEVACDSYTWQGATVTVSGDYTFPHDDANGCTQVDTLHLTINYSVETTVTDTADDSYSWQGTTYTESGTYQWQGTTAEGCDSTVTLMLVINHVGIGEIDNSKMNIDVYPNPTTGQLTIDAEGILSVEVFDPTGRKVATHERTHTIDLRGLPAGTYFLKIHLLSGTSRQRVILK